jgi:hypothetical protein
MSDWLRRYSFAYWYWAGLLQGRFKLWVILLLGTVWIALGVGLHLFLIKETGSGSLGILVVMGGSGLLHFYFAARALAQQRTVDATVEVEPPKHRRVAEPPRPSPPKLASDPFRAPPQIPIAVVKLEVPRAPAPVVAGDPDDKPKLLS